MVSLWGAAAAFVAALLIDRSAFLTRGLLPIGNFVAALPIVGVAPILVNWFGFDWHSKAAVVVVMVFLPHSGEHGAGAARHGCDAAGSDAHLRGGVFSDLVETAHSSRTAFHFQWLEDCHNPCFDRGDCCGVFWVADAGYGISDLDWRWQPFNRFGLG